MPKYDTLSYNPALHGNRRPIWNRDTQKWETPEVQQTSMFLENYRAERARGATHTEAYQTAVDYHRKFTAREATDNWDDVKGTFEDEARFDPAEILNVNQSLRLITGAIRDQLDPEMAHKMLQFVWLNCRLQDTDQHLAEDLFLECAEYCGDVFPDEIKDVAKAMGFTIRPNGSCNSMTRYRQRLVEIANRAGVHGNAKARPAEPELAPA